MNRKSQQHTVGAVLICLLMIGISVSTGFMVSQDTIEASDTKYETTGYKTQAPGDFAHYKSITIDHTKVDESLSNFPVWVYNTSSDFADNILANGSDMAFYDSTNNTQFNHEIEVWNKTTGELGVWVNVTSISSSEDTVFYMYYGDSDTAEQPNHNPTSVWDSNYVLVLHMVGASATDIDDSTANNNDVTFGDGTQLYNQTGKLGNCVDFNGTGKLEIDNSASLETLGGQGMVSFSLWAKQEGAPGGGTNGEFLSRMNAAGGILSGIHNYRYTCGIREDAVFLNDDMVVINDTWVFYTLTFDGSTMNMYRNTSLVNTSGDAGLTEPIEAYRNLTIGAYNIDGTKRFNGTIDEVRISNISRNSSWINATFYNQNNNASFLTFGTQNGESAASVFQIKGLYNNRITFAGTAGTTVYCNSSGGYNEWLEINMSINATDNVTEIRVFIDDLNDTLTWINASNITLYVSNASNETYYNFGTFVDGGSNISINRTTWNNYIIIDNPFNGTGLKYTNTSIFLIFKLTIPADSPTDDFYSSASDSFKIYLGRCV